MSDPEGRGVEFVRSLERGLAVIRAFDATAPEMTLSDVSRRAGLTRAAARRFLHTLVELGYVRTDGRLFSLRPRVLELGFAYLSAQTLPELAQPHLERLVATVSESSSLSVLDCDEIVYIVRVPAKRIMTVAISVGTRFPAYCTSMGRVLLAGQPDDWLDHYLARLELRPFTSRTITEPERLRRVLAKVRAQGFAFVDQELEEQLRSVAAPVHGPGGDVVAAVNISMHAGRGGWELVRRELLPHLLSTTAAISEDMAAGATTHAAPKMGGMGGGADRGAPTT